MPNFNSFLQMVYRAGVTDFWPNFKWIIFITTWILIRFQPKFLQRCALTRPFCVPSFSLIGTSFFVAKIVSMQNEEKEEKTKKQKWNFVSWNWLKQFASNSVCRLAYLDCIFVANLAEFGLDISELHRCKMMYFFFQCTHCKMHWLLGPHNTILCVLI